MDAPLLVVNGFAAASLLLAWGFFRRHQLNRPPLGAFNRTDVVVMLVALVTVPYVYLVLPAWAAATFLGVGVLSILSVALQPVVPGRAVRWAVIATLMGADVALAVTKGAGSRQFLVLNDVVLLLVVVGTATLWAQGGMKATDLALLAAGITVYDVIATTQVSVMADIAERLSTIPFVPFVAWGTPARGLGVGLGDLLVAAVFPLVMRKAYGRTAGRVALASGLVAVVGMLTVLYVASTETLVPAMVVLGPVMLAQIAFWRRRQGAERTTWEYLRAEPLPAAS
ncbi:MAG: hypothetical protein ACRD12_17915 [Acidimicrobiales bacterium]